MPPRHTRAVETLQLSHGGRRMCVHTPTGDLGSFQKSGKWPGLRTVVRVVRTTHRTGTREEPSPETLCRLSGLAADAALHAGQISIVALVSHAPPPPRRFR